MSVLTTIERADAQVPDADAGAEAAQASLLASLDAALSFDDPFPHWILSDLFPEASVEALEKLPFVLPDLRGLSGKRELHNDQRSYFDAAAIEAWPVCRQIAETFQDPATVRRFAQATGADLDGCCLRVEYAQDVTGFWLEPHTDLGVKRLTLLYYLGRPGQDELGTDLYRDKQTWARRSPFRRNSAVLFVPSDRTWHGFEPRPIPGVRRSVIVNYVTSEWRAREQLSYPETPVRA